MYIAYCSTHFPLTTLRAHVWLKSRKEVSVSPILILGKWEVIDGNKYFINHLNH